MGLPTGPQTLDQLYYMATFGLAGSSVKVWQVTAVTGTLAADETADIWSVNGSRTLLTQASTISVVSSSIQDVDGGSGASAISIYGLNENYDEISEIVMLNGTTPVVSTQAFLRINLVFAVDKINVGRIVGTATTGGSTQLAIEIGIGSDESVHLTVPRGKTAVIPSLAASVFRSSGSGRRTATFKIKGSIPGFVAYNVFLFDASNDGSGFIQLNFDVPYLLPEYSDFIVTATAETNATKASCVYSAVIVDGVFTPVI